MPVFTLRSAVVTGAVTGSIAAAQFFGFPFSLTQNGPGDQQRNERVALVDEGAADRLINESPLASDSQTSKDTASSLFGVAQARAAVPHANKAPPPGAGEGSGSASMNANCGKLIACGALVGALAVAPISARAEPDPTNELANAICAAPNADGVAAAVASFDMLSQEDVAEAFGVAAFLGDLGRCANQQAMADAFAFYKKGKDQVALDASFASGRVAAKPEGGGTASAEIYEGSFAALGTAGDPPSGQ